MIEIYPNNGAAKYVGFFTDDEVDKLMLRNDITFADITNLKIYPQNKNLAFPDKPTQQSVVNPININITTSSLKQYLEKLCSHPHRASRRSGSELSVEWIVSTVNAIISSLPEERKKKI